MDCKDLIQTFELERQDLKTLSPLTLAYIGDCVYELALRIRVLESGNQPVDRLNRMSSQLAKAPTQFRIMEELKEFLTEEELAVYKRGRNAKSPTKAKNATVVEYRVATGFEAVIGYLYLQDEKERLLEVLKKAFEIEEKQRTEK